MSWYEGNHYIQYFNPFFQCTTTLTMQNQLLPYSIEIFQQNSLSSQEQAKNIKSLETQSQLSEERFVSRIYPEIKKKTVRKEKIQKKREKQDNFERKKQKKDRNLPSNIFKYFISFLYSHPAICQPTSAAFPIALPVNIVQLISKLKGTIRETQSYIRPASIQELFFGSTLSPEESLAFRILLRRFLLFELPALICSADKYKKRQKRQLVKLGRRLFQQIREKAFQ